MNNFRTWLLMGALTILLVSIGGMVGGRGGMIVFLGLALVMNFVSYYHSDKIAIKMTKSKELTPAEAPDLFQMVRGLSQRAEIPMPRIFLTPSNQPNAFATGRNYDKAVVAVTQGLMDIMDRSELEGVIAHELAHIKNRDILIGSIAASIAGAVMIIADVARFSAMFFGGRDNDNNGGVIGIIAMSVIAPMAALVVQMAISRSREYQADRSGAEIAGNPNGLANALLKLEQSSKRVPMEVSPAAAHMFIINPLSGRSLASLFSTHPSVDSRVQRLYELSGIAY